MLSPQSSAGPGSPEDRTPAQSSDAILSVSDGAIQAPDWQKHYVPVRAKFVASLLVAGGWTALSVWLSLPWLDDLADLVGGPMSIVIITFIAYVPGFMNAFLASTILLDRRPRRAVASRYPGVTILVACFNEADSIEDTLRSIATQHYPGEFEVLVMDDGSTDDTADIAEAAIARYLDRTAVSMRVVRAGANAGKAAVLNRGLALATHECIVTVDGDSWLHSTALQRIVERWISDPPGTRAVAGTVLVRNSRATWVTRAQEWDYFHGIAAVKRMQSMYHGTLVAQGAFSLYDRTAVQEAGGWPDCMGEDIVLSWALLEAGHRIGYAEDALLFTNAPESLSQFALQRERWSRGLMEAFRHHGRLLLKPRMTTLFIWWNVLFLPLDAVYTLAFIPGIVLALFGHYYIVGIMTLAVLPLAALWNLFIHRVQRRMFTRQEMRVRRNIGGLLFYMLGFNILMQPVSFWGYATELGGFRSRWGTK